MAIKHENTSQKVVPVDFRPLLKNEDPYFNNINRGPKDVYDYTNKINDMLSYGGSVSRMRSSTPYIAISLYDIVHILEGELVTISSNTNPANGR